MNVDEENSLVTFICEPYFLKLKFNEPLLDGGSERKVFINGD